MTARRCFLIGIGMGNPATLTFEARELLRAAPLVAGARRMLDCVADIMTGSRFEGYSADSVAEAFAACRGSGAPCVLFSGDTGFHSGATALRVRLEADGWTVTTCPGISSAQYLAARLGRSWQDWRLESAHGAGCDLGCAFAPANGERVFFLTGGAVLPCTIATYLCDHGFPDAALTVASRLSYADEHMWQGSAAAYCGQADAEPACVLVERALPALPCGALDDGFFLRGGHDAAVVPMTKRFVRAAVLSLLAPADGDCVWDIGAGTGAVTIDLARAARCHVYAVEARAEACALIAENRRRAGCANVDVVHGHAPEAFSRLPTPQAVFVGGSGGALPAIVRAVCDTGARLVVSAATLETLSACERLSREQGRRCDVTQLSVAVTRAVGSHHLLSAQNPVWLVSFGAP